MVEVEDTQDDEDVLHFFPTLKKHIEASLLAPLIHYPVSIHAHARFQELEKEKRLLWQERKKKLRRLVGVSVKLSENEDAATTKLAPTANETWRPFSYKPPPISISLVKQVSR